MRNITLLIKPASSLCNLRCRYCFYEDVSDCRSVRNYGCMTEETAGQLIRAAFAAAGPGGQVSFAFQGGEPTAAGLDFFRSFLALEAQYAPSGVTCTHAIQTNGLLLDQDWADFFAAHRFLVGLSLDGTKAFHDSYRLDPQGKGTWNRAVQSLALLQKKQVDVNLLCVVTAQCARSPQKVYNTLKRLGVRYLQFIPCLDPLDCPGGNTPYSLTAPAYGSFLCGLFDAWYADWKRGQYVSIRLFDDYVHLLMGQPCGSCATTGQCGSYLVAEGDGSLYPCDFYVLDHWRLGNVSCCTLEEALTSPLAQRFRAESLNGRPERCAQCPWLQLCQGGCKRDWITGSQGAENRYCSALQTFFSYALPRLQEIARLELAWHRLS